MSISRIQLLNFKNWRTQTWENGIELKPITLILGRNSAGKTSILQPLRMLKQTLETSDDSKHLVLSGVSGDGVDLGQFEDIISDHDTTRSLGVGLALAEKRLAFRVEFSLSGEMPKIFRLAYQVEDEQVAVERTANGWELSSPRFRLPTWDGDKDVNRPQKAFEPHRALEFSEEALEALGPTLGKLVRRSMRELRQVFRSFHYLGPLRPPPARAVAWQQQEVSKLGDDGRETIQVLIGAMQRKEGRRLLEQVSAWLQRLGLAERLEVVREATAIYKLEIVREGQRANLVDVGYGVSQVLPLIVLLHFVPEGSMVLVEDPEAHLHPLAQAELANLLVEVARQRSLQVLVETHSEYLFRRLQYLVAEGVQLTQNDCALYYVERDQPESKLTRLVMDEYGRLKNWPKHFFGDSLGETERQIEVMFNRMEAERHGR